MGSRVCADNNMELNPTKSLETVYEPNVTHPKLRRLSHTSSSGFIYMSSGASGEDHWWPHKDSSFLSFTAIIIDKQGILPFQFYT